MNLCAKAEEDYARAFSQDIYIRDADDCCTTAVFLLKLLLRDQKEEFIQNIIMTISELNLPLQQESNPNDPVFGATQ
jgi:hypothetical protein